jgi:small subunit ribosomal protein S1
VTDLDPKKRNLVVSRKQILIEERDALKNDAWGKIEEGQEVTGIVKTVKEYGAFVDLGGVDGLLHVGEISWNRINHPQDVLSVGQEIQVKILKIETDKKKISLGMKQLISNPWDHAEIRYAKDATVSGIITRMTDFGAFVELEKGVEGLLHISEIEHRRIATVQEVLKVGQEIQAKVLEFNKNKKRISLSMKSLIDRPEPVKPAFEQKEEPQDQRNKKQAFNPNLKGGMGGNNPGGLFGNPRDFK